MLPLVFAWSACAANERMIIHDDIADICTSERQRLTDERVYDIAEPTCEMRGELIGVVRVCRRILDEVEDGAP